MTKYERGAFLKSQPSSHHDLASVNRSSRSIAVSEGPLIPPTPNCTPEESRASLEEANRLSNLVVLTRVTRFLPCHILNTLIAQEYTVRGIITQADKESDVDALYNIHPWARKYLFVNQVSPLNQREWERVFDSAKYVIHMIAPIPSAKKGRKTSASSDDESGMVEDILRKIMAACVKTSVQRFVLITSVASIAWSTPMALSHQGPINEDSWEDEENLDGYALCQLACEKIAWSFMNDLPESTSLEFVVLNPAFILGPIVQGKSTNTVSLIKALMQNTLDEVPEASYLPLVDVRDVARAAAVALVKNDVVGHRHILYGSTVSCGDMARQLDMEFGPQGYDIQTKKKSKEYGACAQCFPARRKRRRTVPVPVLDDSVCIEYDNTRMQDVLGVEPRNPEETIIETAYSLIYWDMVKKPGKSALSKATTSR